mgnify:CR=1 FL=1
MLLLLLSFIAGILTVLAPCTLTLLPVIVGSSVSGIPSRKKAIIITASLGASIIIFTLLLKVSSVFINIPAETWSIISGFIIIIFGIFSLVPELWEDMAFVGKLNRGSNRLLGVGYQREGLLGHIIIGISLGPVFASCSPTYFIILATVLPQSLLVGVIYLIVYAAGLSGTLLLIALLGQKIIGRVEGLSDTRGWLRRTLGALFILIGVLIVFGLDKKIDAKLLSGVLDITRDEQPPLRPLDPSTPQIDFSTTTESEIVESDGTIKTIQKTHGPKAPEIVNPSGFINTDGKPITIREFKGKKVVLLDIWTYSCINCQRTFPYLKAWYEKYKDQGLVIIGLHTPEFAFEKVKVNVENAAKEFGLTYPIVMDNNFSTWTAYGNQYWPRKYLISGDGEIVYDHIGEGNYEETEMAIQRALSELNGTQMTAAVSRPDGMISYEPGKVGSPEVYFGSDRNEYLANGRAGLSGDQKLTLPAKTLSNSLYFEGIWNFNKEYARSKTSGKILFKYRAKNVYMVASSDAGVSVRILKDGKVEKTLFIKANQLYSLVEGDDYSEHTLEIDTPAGLDAFTFTFG